MKTLVIPDVHENVWAIKALEDEINKAERIVFLGDFFDTFNPDKKVAEMIALVKSLLLDERCTVLLGNHDCHYYFPNHAFCCSGYRPATREAVQAQITKDEIRKIRIWTKVGPYVVSHAGFHEDTLPMMKEEIHKEAMELGIAGTRVHPLFAAGRARGGPAKVGGPTWCDWNHEFEPIEGLPQIVGHTVGRVVRQAGVGDDLPSYCLDTNQRTAAWVDEETGDVEIVDIKL